MLTLRETLTHHRIAITPDFQAAKMQRLKSQWLHAYEYGSGDQSIQVVYFGCYKTGFNEVWRGDDSHLSEEAKKGLKALMRKAQATAEQAREEERIRVKALVQSLWPNFSDRGTTEYLERKGINKLYGCKIDINDHGPFLLVPMYDIEGTLWNYQRICNVKLSGGDKFMRSGGRVEGLFHCLTQIFEEGTIYIAEGFATAASISIALSDAATVICAFNAGNLSPVAKAIRSKYPKARIVLCADNDNWVFKPDGKQWNPGIEYARKAAGAIAGEMVYPRFLDCSTRPTDFNDLHALEGLAAVKDQLLNPQSDAAGPTVTAPGGEAAIVRDILSEYEGTILKVNRDVFVYRGTHWHHWNENVAEDFFYKQIDNAAGGKWKHKDIMSARSRLYKHIPTPPEGVDMFAPRPDCINLLNGTIHLKRGQGRKYALEFHPHDPGDFLANILPFNYNPEDMHVNEILLNVIQKVFKGDKDAKEKAVCVQEMYGTVICGIFPGLFMQFGPPGTGKSTIANIARRLVGPGNSCSVPPTRWFGFHMWSMIGKQVNIDTDIPTQGKISDDTIKKVIESIPVYIQRKNMTDVETKLPSSNIFCANKLPPFIDGSSGAQGRRWVMIEYNVVVIPDAECYDSLYWDYVFDSDPQGVFNFALLGLLRLCERQGIFSRNESGKAKVREWENESEEAGKAVADFVQAAKEGECQVGNNLRVSVGEGLKIERTKFWEAFKSHYQSVSLGYGGPTRSEVYAAMQRTGFSVKVIDGTWFFSGIGVKETPASML